jgi:protein-disulfide isomerase
MKKSIIFTAIFFAVAVVRPSDSFAAVQPDRRVTLVEFFDFSCPLSAKGVRSIALIKKIFSGKIKIVRKAVPSFDDSFSNLASKYFYALKEQNKKLGKKFYDRVFEDVFKTDKNENYLQILSQKLGADLARLKRDLLSPRFASLFQKNEEEARDNGIFVSPGYLLDGEAFVGKQDVEVFVSHINKALKK